MNYLEQFNKEKADTILLQGKDKSLIKLGIDFLLKTAPTKYTYHFNWMGRPIIALPQDMIAMQEIIWQIKPDLIIETGVAHGGSIVYTLVKFTVGEQSISISFSRIGKSIAT